jgi:hydroxyethylthiazole kinase-like uncharacterized protein yjeF
MAIPVVSVAQMKAIDSASAISEADLIQRAGTAAGETAVEMLEASNGKNVCVIVGPGKNGGDGRVAAEYLKSRNYEVTVLAVEEMGETISDYDLIIDAAYGTGFRGEFFAPDTNDTPVLSLDIPSGINGDTGHSHGAPFVANTTITFGAIKTGLLFGEGPENTGELLFNDVGLEAKEYVAELVTAEDVFYWLPARSRSANKWSAAACVIAGSPGMYGAADLCAMAAYRSGAGMVRLLVPGVMDVWTSVLEAVSKAIPSYELSDILPEVNRCHAVAIGPGLGRSESVDHLVRNLLVECPLPLVIDGDGLTALGSREEASSRLRPRISPTILTPHDGEFARLADAPPGANRIEDVRALAKEFNSFILLKGPTTIIAAPYGKIYLTNAGDERLATAGAGDVLTGIIVSLLAQGMAPFEATTAAAFIHGDASQRGFRRGLVARDLPELLPHWFEDHA